MPVPSERDAALALLPGLAEAHGRLHAAVWEQVVPPSALERCRLRMAQLLGATAALEERSPAAPLTEEQVARIPQWPTDPTLDEGERACLALAELFVIDPHAVDDDTAAGVVAAYGDAGLVALTTALGLWENQHRFDNALRLLAGETREA